MKIGVTVRNIGGFAGSDGGVHDCLLVARHAERLGFDSVWAADHVVIPERSAARYPYNTSGVPSFSWQTPIHEPLALLSALAQTTERVEIGIAVLVIPYRHPIMTAKMLATADQLSGGRVILGAGVGWLREEFEGLGLPPAYFDHRGSVTDDYLRAMKEAWLNTGPARYTGEYVRFTDVGTFPHPVRTPHIPIWTGGKGRQALRRAVRLGNGYLAISSDPAILRDEVAELRRLSEADRRDPEELTVAAQAGIILTHSPAPAGRDPLTGTPEQVIEGLRQYADAGLQHLVTAIRAEGDPSREGTLAAMERFAAEVLPVMRAGAV